MKLELELELELCTIKELRVIGVYVPNQGDLQQGHSSLGARGFIPDRPGWDPEVAGRVREALVLDLVK